MGCTQTYKEEPRDSSKKDEKNWITRAYDYLTKAGEANEAQEARIREAERLQWEKQQAEYDESKISEKEAAALKKLEQIEADPKLKEQQLKEQERLRDFNLGRPC